MTDDIGRGGGEGGAEFGRDDLRAMFDTLSTPLGADFVDDAYAGMSGFIRRVRERGDYRG